MDRKEAFEILGAMEFHFSEDEKETAEQFCEAYNFALEVLLGNES